MHEHVWGPIWEGAVAPVVTPVVNAVKAGAAAVKAGAAAVKGKPAAAAPKKKFKQVLHAPPYYCYYPHHHNVDVDVLFAAATGAPCSARREAQGVVPGCLSCYYVQ